MFKAAGLRMGKFKFPSREPRHKATEADLAAYEALARGQKPPPMVIEAATVENTSNLPNAETKKPWTRPTISIEAEAIGA